MTTESTVAIIAVLWALFLVVLLAWCLSCCCFRLCCPAKLSHCLACLTVVLALVAILVTALLTHKLDALGAGTRRAVSLSFQGARFLAHAAVAEPETHSSARLLRLPRVNT